MSACKGMEWLSRAMLTLSTTSMLLSLGYSQITLPYSGSGNTTSTLFQLTQNGTGSVLRLDHNASTTNPSFNLLSSSGADNTIGLRVLMSSTTGIVFGIRSETRSSSGRAIYAFANATTGTNYGLFAETRSSSGIAVRALANASSGANFGLYAETRSTTGTAVHALASTTTGRNIAISAETRSPEGVAILARSIATTGTQPVVSSSTNSPLGTAIRGIATATSGSPIGVSGVTFSPSGTAVFGLSASTAGITYGVEGWSDANGGVGVFGWATAPAGATRGVIGLSNSTDGIGVAGIANAPSGMTYGVYGRSDSLDGFGVFCEGDFAATGLKAFRIDHPLRPETHYLNHFCAEGPEPYNIYAGVVTLDARGEAWVTLPDYFEAINQNPRYLLTPIGAPMPNLHVAVEVTGNRFKIAGGAPNGRVSWEIKATRNDPWIQRYGYHTTPEKLPQHQGKYLHPELYGHSPERRVIPLNELRATQQTPTNRREVGIPTTPVEPNLLNP
jgi:hypothetical protein